MKLHIIFFQQCISRFAARGILSCLFRELLYAICCQVLSLFIWDVAKKTYDVKLILYTFVHVVSEATRTEPKKIQKCVKKLSKFIRMSGIDYRLIVFINKNHKISENTWCFKTRVDTVSTDTPVQVYGVSCPKVAFFHRFWLKGHEKPSSTTKPEHV